MYVRLRLRLGSGAAPAGAVQSESSPRTSQERERDSDACKTMGFASHTGVWAHTLKDDGKTVDLYYWTCCGPKHPESMRKDSECPLVKGETRRGTKPDHVDAEEVRRMCREDVPRRTEAHLHVHLHTNHDPSAKERSKKRMENDTRRWIVLTTWMVPHDAPPPFQTRSTNGRSEGDAPTGTEPESRGRKNKYVGTLAVKPTVDRCIRLHPRWMAHRDASKATTEAMCRPRNPGARSQLYRTTCKRNNCQRIRNIERKKKTARRLSQSHHACLSSRAPPCTCARW